MADPPAWFVVPVQPGLLQQLTGYFTGSHGTYKVVKTFVGHPLYEEYLKAGYGPPYSSYAAAVAAAKQLAGEASKNALPPAGPSAISPGSSAQQGPSLPGLAAIGDFFSKLGQANTWIRVAEFILGVILIAAGVARITNAIPAATKIATKVGTKGLV